MSDHQCVMSDHLCVMMTDQEIRGEIGKVEEKVVVEIEGLIIEI